MPRRRSPDHAQQKSESHRNELRREPSRSYSRRRKRTTRIALWSGATAGLLVALGLHASWTRVGSPESTRGMINSDVDSALQSEARPSSPPVEKPRSLTVLLIGTDSRPRQALGNTDTMMVVNVDYLHRRIEILSIPRDTKVRFPDGASRKINAAYSVGGVSLASRMIEDLIGFDIPNYAVTHFRGLVDMINTLGGVSLYVPQRMYYNTGDKQYGIINLHKGYQKLNGQKALAFVRFRADPRGDIGRTQRQQQFMKALIAAALRPSTVIKLPMLVPQAANAFETNLSMAQVLKIASEAGKMRGFRVVSQTLPGAYHNPRYAGDLSYWIVSPTQAKLVTKRLFVDGIVSPNIFETEDAVGKFASPVKQGDARSNKGTTAIGQRNPAFAETHQNLRSS